MNLKLGEIVELKAFGMAFTTVGRVVSLSPLQCELKGGYIYEVKSATVIPLREDLQKMFEKEFKNEKM